jgi:hypothetical protein
MWDVMERNDIAKGIKSFARLQTAGLIFLVIFLDNSSKLVVAYMF